MSRGRGVACVVAISALLLGLTAAAHGFTTTQIVHYPETSIASNVTTPPGPSVSYPITAVFQQLDPAKATLNQVTLEYQYDFSMTMTIPEFGGGSAGASIQNAFFVNGFMIGGAGTGTGNGGGGPAVITTTFSAPAYPSGPGIITLSAVAPNPDAFAAFVGTGTATFLWDAAYSVYWQGSPGGLVDFVMKNTSYVKITYDYTPVCGSPFADADKDSDVDMNDFAQWQRCYFDETAPAVFEVCYCLDADKSGKVDADDLQRFMRCWSGPSVIADPTCTGV